MIGNAVEMEEQSTDGHGSLVSGPVQGRIPRLVHRVGVGSAFDEEGG